MSETEKFIIDFLQDNLPGTEVRPEDDLLDCGLLDSLRILALVSELEEAYDIEIDVEEITMETFSTVQTIAVLADAKRSG